MQDELTHGSDDFVVLTNLGRSALHLSLEALQLPAESAVILPSYACAGVVVPVLRSGLRPAYADVGDDLNLTIDTVQAAWSPDVSAVVVPHLAGVWTRDLPAIVAWARARGIRVIEDAAQAHGLVVDGVAAGRLGDVAIFSSGGGKPIFGPGGGWLTTADAELAARAAKRLGPPEAADVVNERLRRFVDGYVSSPARRGRRQLVGRLRPVTGKEAPSPYAVAPIADIEAALALSVMPRLASLIEARRAHAQLWRASLRDVGGEVLRIAPERDSTAQKLWLSFRGADPGARATEARDLLWSHGVETESLYVPLHLRASFGTDRHTDLARTERLWRGIFSVPVRPTLTARDRRRIGDAASALAHMVQQAS
jgi:dTDP-4-amino-4,6-dideoxygalactose transaminase